jgi:glycosyltransferase involved in cell wall biosynthesis
MTSTSFPSDDRDWRGRFIYKAAEAVGAVDGVKLRLWSPPGALPGAVAGGLLADDAEWLIRLGERGGIAHLLRSRNLATLGAVVGLMRRLRRAYRSHRGVAVVHANWLQTALPLIGTRTPAVIAVLGTDYGLLRLPGMTWLIRAMLRTRRAVLAPNGAWMVAGLRERFGDLADVVYIPFGVDARLFDLVRTPFETEQRQWLLVSRLTRAKIGRLFEWGESLFVGPRRLDVLGPMQERIDLPAWVRYHGPTNPDELRQRWFPRAAGLVTLSEHDEGRPQVMLEAMAAGLPIVASDIAAHRDFIAQRSTGLLVSSPEEFVEALGWLERHDNNDLIGRAARAWAAKEIGTWRTCAERYVSAYARVAEVPR